MPIQFKCPNGHELRVKDKFAGQAGLCPRCQVRVLVPSPAKAVNEDAILEMLGPPNPVPTANEPLPVHQEPRDAGAPAADDSAAGSGLMRSTLLHRGTKKCPKCHREVRVAYNLCPHCRTYFTDRGEITRRIESTCKSCGKEVNAGDVNCPHCGVDLRIK